MVEAQRRLTAVTLAERVPQEAADAAVTVTPASPPAPHHLPVGQSIRRGALALLSTQPVTWGVSLLSTALAPRLLGAEALGQLAVAVTICSLASTAACFGVSELLVRRVAQRPDSLRRDAGVAFAVQLASSLIAALAIVLLGLLIPSSMVPYPLLVVALIPMVVLPAQTVLLSVFRGSERHKPYAWFNAAGFVASTIGGLLVLVAGGDVVLSTAVGGALLLMVTLLGWRMSRLDIALPRLDRALLSESRDFIRAGFPFLLWQITLLAYGQVDRVLLGLFVPASEIGWYAAAYRIIGVVVFVPTLVVAPLFPALSRSAEDFVALRRTIAQTLRPLMVVMVGLGAASIVVAPVVPRLLGWPADFDKAVPLMSILALHLPMVAVDMVLGVVLMAIHRESGLVIVGVIALVFNVICNLVSIPYFEQTAGDGAIGAAIVTVLTEVVMFVGGAVILIPKRLLDPAIAWEACRLLVAGAAGVFVGLTLVPVLSAAVTFLPLTFVLLGLSATATFVGVAVLLRALTLDDARSLAARLPRPKR